MDSVQKRAFLIGGVVVLYLLVCVLWISSNRFIRAYVDDKLHTVEQQYAVSIRYDAISIKGINRVEISKLTIIPDESDTLLTAGSLAVKLSLPKLLFFQPEITGTEIHDLFIYNTRGLLLPEPVTGNYARRMEEFLQTLYTILPRQVSLHNLKVSYNNREEEILFDIQELLIQDSRFITEVRCTEKGITNEWICKGAFLEEEQKIDLRLYAKEKSRVALPFVEERLGACIQFDTLVFELQSFKRKPDVITLQGKGGVKGLALYDERLATDTIHVNRGFANYLVDIGENYVEVDKRTSVHINKLKLNPYLKAEKKKDWHIVASLDKENFPAGELFGSIPKGLFRHVEGLEADGTLTYHFFLDVDMTNVERLKFRSTLDSRNFRILQFGNTDLRMMNGPFTHAIYEKETPVRMFILGTEDPNFRPYQHISRYLPYAIMHGEDAGFYNHKGFLQDAFRRSLVQNIEERRFARGGSTLSMQVVKNVFLSRNKTIARKLEEIMIVWLIETNKLTSKRRMFEVYMNVIEWGPNVYGIREAAHFYFRKEPSALTLTECIFLAYILPAPKHVKSHFNGLQIRPAFRPFYYDAVKRIYQRHWITERERMMSNPNLIITGPAINYLLK